MRNRFWSNSIFVLLSAALLGCADHTTAPQVPPPANSSEALSGLSPTSTNTDGADAYLSPVTVSFTASGGSGPQGSIAIAARVTANIEGRYQITVWMPDVDRAVAGNWKGHARLTRKYRAFFEADYNLSSGEARDFQFRVPVVAAGVYGIVFKVVRGPDAHPEMRLYNPGHVKEDYIVVDSNGSRVLGRTFQPADVPVGMEPRPGMYVRRGTSTVTSAVQGSELFAAGVGVCDGICGYLRFTNYETARDDYVGPAQLSVRILGLEFLKVDVGAAGDFVIPCPVHNDMQVVVELVNPYVRMANTGNSEFYVSSENCGQTSDYFIWPSHAFYYKIGSLFAPRAQQQYGFSARPTLQVTHTTSGYVAGDLIELNVDGAWTRGRFILGHEYGHWVMSQVLGSNPTGGCPEPHSGTEVSNYGCAMREGFASAFSVDVWGSDLQFSPQQDDRTQYGDFEYGTRPSGTTIEGGAVELRVARYILDILDGMDANEGDGIDLTSYQVGRNIWGCSTSKVSIGWIQLNGIDDLHYCLEDGIPPEVSQFYFLPVPLTTAQMSPADNLSADTRGALRASMRRNLYSEQ